MREKSGVRGFDELVDGGLPGGRLYVLSGPPGSGKTTFSAHFVTRGVQNGEKCFYLTMHESEEAIRQDMSGFDFGFEEALDSTRLRFESITDPGGKSLLGVPDGDHTTVENSINRFVSFLNSKDVDRVVVDSMMLLEYLFSNRSENAIQFLAALKQTDATVLLISEMTDPTSYSDEHYLAHGVVFLHNFLDTSGMTRGIQIVKMRGTSIDTNIHKLDFSRNGLAVSPEEKVTV